MATIVLVHGIAQEQLGPASLEKNWLPALSDGVAKSGHQALADRIWRGGVRGDIDIRMAYYGTPFIDEGAQGGGEVDLDTEPLPEGAEELTNQLAAAWLQAAAQAAKDPTDRRTAQDELKIIAGNAGEAQGPRGTLGRPVLNALAELRWFAPFGMAVAGRFVWKCTDPGQPLPHRRQHPHLRPRSGTQLDRQTTPASSSDTPSVRLSPTKPSTAPTTTPR